MNIKHPSFLHWLAHRQPDPPALQRRTLALHNLTALCDNDAMHRLLATLDSPAANLALDEALVDRAEADGPRTEFLRLWESPQPMVVVGRSSRVEQEIHVRACVEREIPILRRASGGAAIVAGPGCLMYAVVLSYERLPQLRAIPEAHRFVLGRLADALRPHVAMVELAGTSDLAMAAGGRRKFSGNSLRAKRTHFLYHGTLLYDFDLSLVAECLKLPPRRPAYRGSRGHEEFLTNLPMSKSAVEAAVLSAWPTEGELVDWPRDGVQQLVLERYGQAEWNLTFPPIAAV